MPRLIVLLLALLIGSWFLFDGSRCLLTGNYTTPQSGPYQDQLGPWATVVRLLGMEPMSAFIKIVHVMLGGLWLIAGIFYYRSKDRYAKFLVVMTGIFSLWYFPFGTLAAILVAACLVFEPAMDRLKAR